MENPNCDCRELGLAGICCDEQMCPCEGDPDCCGKPRKKIRLTWVWLNREDDIFTTQSPEEVAKLVRKNDPLLKCTEKVLTSWFEDDWGWYPNHPVDFENKS